MTWGTQRAGTPAPRWRALLTALALTVPVLGGCTSQGAGPAAGATAASPAASPGVSPGASAAASSAASAAHGPDPGMTPVGPDPGMTPVPEAKRCITPRPLTGRGLVPLDAVFPGAETSATSDPKEVVPGPDAADRSRCPGVLPSQPRCRELVPWTGLLPDAFVPASGVRRLVNGYLLTMPKQAGNQAPPESSAGTKVVTFALVDLAPRDPAGFGDYLDAAFATCAKATPTTAAGVRALVGTVPSEYGAGTAEVVLLRRGDHLVWAALDGSGWEQGEQQRAVAVLVSRLL